MIRLTHMCETRVTILREGAMEASVISSLITYSKTEKLVDYTATILLETESGTLDWVKISDYVKHNTEAIALSVRDDLLLILDAMKEVSNRSVLFDEMDCIQINSNGMPLFRISTGNRKGLSVCVDMNEYTRRLLTRKSGATQIQYPSLLFGVFLGVIFSSLLSAVVKVQ